MPDSQLTVAALIEDGNRLAEAGRLEEAKVAYEHACQKDGQSALAYFGLGTVQYQLNDDENAVEALTKAVKLSPDTPEIWNNLGASLGRSGNIRKAIIAFKNVCSLRPDHAAAAMNLGRLLLNEGEAEQAERWLRQANDVRPLHSETLRLMAEARVAMGQPRMAVTAAEKAIKADPNNWSARLVLGHAYLAVRKLDAARKALTLVLEHQPNHPEATYYLAETEEKSGRIDLAFISMLKLKRALALPVIAESHGTIATDRQRIETALAELPRSDVADPYGAGGFTNFYLAYQGQNDRILQQDVAKFYLETCPDLASSAPHVSSPPKRDRFKVAVLSSFMRNHTVGYLSRGLIENLDRKRFTVALIRSPLIPIDDPAAPAIAAMADEVIDLPDNLSAARTKVADVADVAADLIYFPEIGMEDPVYFLAFARSAPVQVVGWDHPVTTGIPNVVSFSPSQTWSQKILPPITVRD